jgi:hypothetical protein
MMVCRWIRYDSTKRSGVLDEEKRSQNRSLRNTVEKLKKRRLCVFNIDLEGMVKQVRFYPR